MTMHYRFTMAVFPDQETSDISRTRRKDCFTSAWSMTIGGRHFSDVLNGHLWPEGLQRFSNWGPFEGPSSCDSRTFGRKGTGCHWNGCTKDMTQQEQTLAQLKVGPKEHEKIWKKKKEMYPVHFV